MDIVLSAARRKWLARAMISLCEAFRNQFEIPGVEAEQTGKSAQMLKCCLEKALPGCCGSRLLKQVQEEISADPGAREILAELIRETQEKRPKRGLWRIIPEWMR